MMKGMMILKIDVTWTITAIIAVSSFLSPIAVAIINNLHQAKMRKIELDHDRQIKELNLKQQAIIRQADIYYADKKSAYSEVLRCAGTFASNKKSAEKYRALHSAIDTAFLFCSYGTRSYLDYFLELDDDYREFSWRWGKDDELKQTITNQLDSIFEVFLQFLDDSGALTVALSQNGDFIGGLHGGNYQKELTRKAMNAFFCKTDSPFKFFGRINEDTNMYVYYGSIGKLVFTSMLSSLEQEPTQQNNNGMTNLYLDYGTYLKSFYSVMMNPSVVSLMKMGDVNMRIHHKVNWKYLTPKIISDRYKK